MSVRQFLKDWILPIAMLAGAGGYFLFHYAGFLSPMKPAVWKAVEVLTPSLIFIQLFLTFCKIDFKDLRISRWHWIILAFQTLSALVMAGVLIFVPMDETYREIFEGAMVCLICPTATAAAVVTDKLGGSAARITVYNLMSNILAAAFVPLVFPLVEVHQGAGFVSSFLKILSKVFPLLICPFLLAVLIKYLWPKAHDYFRDHAGVAFYLWAGALALAIGQTVRSMHNSTAPALLSLGGGSGPGYRADSALHAQQYGSGSGAVASGRCGPAQLCTAVLVREAYRARFRGHHNGGTGSGAEEYGAGYLDGLYLSDAGVVAGAGHICYLAKHFQFLAVVAAES